MTVPLLPARYGVSGGKARLRLDLSPYVQTPGMAPATSTWKWMASTAPPASAPSKRGLADMPGIDGVRVTSR